MRSLLVIAIVVLSIVATWSMAQTPTLEPPFGIPAEHWIQISESAGILVYSVEEESLGATSPPGARLPMQLYPDRGVGLLLAKQGDRWITFPEIGTVPFGFDHLD